ncbi:E3 ubiquitin-protein ligase SIRP1-like [Oryza glaberrima]|nr:E3 ubiquitin-protein ligase SIRP1-like [Oryza glaberrima]
MRRVGQPRHARAFTPLLWCRSLTTAALCFGRRRQSSAISPQSTGSGSLDVEGMALADYFFGPELDDLMQWLGDGDVGRKGTLPTKKEAREAMPTVEVTAGHSASAFATASTVCREDYAAGEHATGTPYRHRFHASALCHG